MSSYLEQTVLDFQEYLPCVHFCEREPGMVETVSKALPDFRVWVHDLSAHPLTAIDLLSALGTTLQFPDYYGKNWNAFIECVTDFYWAEAPGHCLILENAQAAWATNPLLLGDYVEVCELCVAKWQKYGMRFHTIFVLNERSAPV